MWYINLDRSFYRFVTIHACDRQTDGQTDRRTDRILIARPRLHCMQRGKNRRYARCGSVSAKFSRRRGHPTNHFLRV